MKVYLDDERPTPDGWIGVKTSAECIELLKSGEVTHLSLDHDLGFNVDDNGYKVCLWLEDQVFNHGFKSPRHLTVHSQNVSAKEKMHLCLRAIRRFEMGIS